MKTFKEYLEEAETYEEAKSGNENVYDSYKTLPEYKKLIEMGAKDITSKVQKGYGNIQFELPIPENPSSPKEGQNKKYVVHNRDGKFQVRGITKGGAYNGYKNQYYKIGNKSGNDNQQDALKTLLSLFEKRSSDKKN